MGQIKVISAKILYGLLFVLVIPALLILWAKNTASLIRLPMPEELISGYLLLIIGIFLVLSGMLNLLISGKGLPMNAFPPAKFVRSGIYSFTKHPIYSGAVFISFGLSVITRSASGFCLVSPLFTLMIFAYVIGFENERTRAVFGDQEYKTFLSLPDSETSAPVFKERLAASFLVFIPWLMVYLAFIYTGIPVDAINTNLPFEKSWPIIEFSGIFYVLSYPYSLLIPLITKTKVQLRNFMTDLWFAIIFVGIFYLVSPFIVDQKHFLPHTFFGKLILFDRSMDGQTCALPSFHVIWAFITARYFTRSFPQLKYLWYLLALLISASCITTGAHSFSEVIVGFCVYLLIISRFRIWNFIRKQAERLANSWHEWRVGPVRIINHGLWGGAAGFSGTLISFFFLGPHYALVGFTVLVFVIIGAGLWAQFIEGSPKLLRPYGYYGGLTGGIIACIAASFIFHINIYFLIGSFAMSAPWIQAIGRLRCLVQGCCHGRPTNEKLGIHFTHPLSRVNKISELKGVALHPTQLYSIGCNLVTGLILIRMFTLGMPAVFIIGIYLILNGIGRFVEESLRGEAQTPYWAGMRIYQWIAIINIVIGAFVTTIPSPIKLFFQFNTVSIFYAIGMGILVTIASGVDFPDSNKRFARLTSN
jgi:protein-S-isoprenylcysteine O-methyltransferase Ste14